MSESRGARILSAGKRGRLGGVKTYPFQILVPSFFLPGPKGPEGPKAAVLGLPPEGPEEKEGTRTRKGWVSFVLAASVTPGLLIVHPRFGGVRDHPRRPDEQQLVTQYRVHIGLCGLCNTRKRAISTFR